MWKKLIDPVRNKRGSYIVEAAMVVPIFIMAMMLLVGIIPVISTCERITWHAGEEMRLEMAKSAVRSNSAVLPASIGTRIYASEKNLQSFVITEYRYRYTEGTHQDRISLRFRCTFRKNVPMGQIQSISFTGKIVGRAFTGTYYQGTGETGDLVYIFPRDGERYHGKSCTFIVAQCRQAFLSDDIRKNYHPCPNCQAKNATLGSPVFVFETAGKAYHMGSCNAVDRYYIQIGKNQAEEKGYSACNKCGGH